MIRQPKVNSNCKTVMIVGGGWEQLPIIQRAKEKGLKVILVDGNSECLGRKIADEFYHVDNRDREAIREIAVSKNIDAISYMITETAIDSVNYAAGHLNLQRPGDKATAATVSKVEMRKMLSKAGIANINYSEIKHIGDAQRIINNFKYPVIVKPSEGSGQVGLDLIHSAEEVECKVSKAINTSKNGKAILEEFIDGPEVNGVGIVIDGKLKEFILSDRIKSSSEGFGVVQRHLYPAAIDYAIIEKYTSAVIEALDVQNGVIFPQFLINDGLPVLCEIGVRIPGGIMQEMFEYSTGIDLVEFQLDLSLSELKNIDHYRTYPVYDAVTVKFINAVNNQLYCGEVDEIIGVEIAQKVPGVLKLGTFVSPNKLFISPLKESKDRFFYIIAGAKTTSDVIRATNAATCLLSFKSKTGKEMNRIPFNMEP